MRRKPSITTAIACLALFLATTGSAIAAGHYLVSSTSQIKPSVLKALKGKRGPAGPAGSQGAQGPAGTAGAAGTSFTTADITEVPGTPVSMCALGGGSCEVGAGGATCPTGTVVIGGGWLGGSTPPVDATVSDNGPTTNATTWEVVIANNSTSSAPSFTPYAICAS